MKELDIDPTNNNHISHSIKQEIEKELKTKSIRQISREKGVGRATISAMAKEMGIEIKPRVTNPKRKWVISKEELIQLLGEKPADIIAKEKNVSVATVRRLCRVYGIISDDRGRWRRSDIPFTKEELERMVKEKRLSEIARAYNLEESNLRYRCEIWNIQLPKRGTWYKVDFNPSKEELEQLVHYYPVNKIAEMCEIDRDVIYGRCKEHDIQPPGKGYWNRLKPELVENYVKNNYPGYEILEFSDPDPNSKVRIRCNNGHEAWVLSNKIMNSNIQYCDACKAERRYKSQRTCKEIAESIFGEKFEVEKRFSWFTNEQGNQRKVDMFLRFKSPLPSGIKGIAIEYNGGQHYRFIEYFHRTIERFLKCQREDRRERQMFKQHDIYLLEVPYTVPIENIRRFILQACARHGITTRNQS